MAASDNAQPSLVPAKDRYSHATSELLRIRSFADDKRHMRVPVINFDYRLGVLSFLIVIIAMYANLAVVHRMKSARGAGWFAWLGGGASGMGIGIWLMHYLGLRMFGSTVPKLDCSSVIYSILATISASGLSLLVAGKSDSGRRSWRKARGNLILSGSPACRSQSPRPTTIL